MTLAQRLHLGAVEHEPGFPGFEDEVVVPRLAIGDEEVVATTRHQTVASVTVPRSSCDLRPCRPGVVHAASLRDVRPHEHRDRARRSRRCTSTPTGTGRSGSRGCPDVILHPPVPLPEVVAFHQEHFPEVRDFDDFIPRPHARTLGRRRGGAARGRRRDALSRSRSRSITTASAGGTTDLTTRTSVAPGPAPRRDRRARRRGRAGTTSSSGSTTRCSTGGIPTTPTASGTSTPTCGRSSPTSSSGSSRSCCGATVTGVTTARGGVPIRSSRTTTRRCTRSGSRVASTTASARATPTTRSTSTTCPRSHPTGAWELCRGLSYSFCFNRAERDDDHLTRAAARRDAHRGGRQGRQPAAEHRSQGRRLDPGRSRHGSCVTPAPG